MRRLPPLTTSLITRPNLPSPSPLIASLSSIQLCGSTASSSTPAVSAGVHRALLFSVTGMATAAAATAVRPASSTNPGSHFTSFEVESELQWAQEDLRELQTPLEGAAAPPSALPETPTLPSSSPPLPPPFLDNSRHYKMEEETHVGLPHAAKGIRPVKAMDASRPVDGPCPSLPSCLQHRRWCDAAHERRGKSVPGYVDAAREVLVYLGKAWRQQRDARTYSHAVGDSSFAALTASLLRDAHVEALLVLLELVVSPHLSSSVYANVIASLNEPRASLLPCLMQLLYRRQVEVSGRHMAQLSQLLLAYSPVFVAASQHAAVWDLFTLLCYATRRRLRRKHNRDCLEAFLWGLYDPLSRDEEFSKNADGVHLLNTADGFVFGRPSPRATQGGSHLQLPSCNDVRVATLHHLLYRCLQTETSLQIDAQAAAHIELLLSWALLLAGDDMRPFMRDAVVHRLCKPITPSNTGASAGRRISTLESVRQWRRLALRHNEAPLRHVEENDKGGRGKHGKALLPAAAVFNTVEREARQTGGWAVPAMERCLLSTLMHSTHLPTGTQRNTSSAATTRYRKPTRSTKAEKTESELRLAGAAAATPRAYARLRWGSLDSGLPPYSSTTTPTAARLLQRRQASSEEEIAELMHTALELPKHAWCLAEAVAVRLVRCLRLRAAYPVAAPRATSVTRRQLLAAFRRLARHSRVGVLTHALVLESDDTATLSAAPTKDGCGEDPFSFAEFAAAATLTLVRHIHSDEDAAQIIGVWWYERSTAATHISPDVLRRLRAWVEALPPPLLSEQLARTFEQLSQLETSVPSSASFAGSYLLTSSEDKVNDSDAKEVWKAIIAAAQPHNTAQPVQVQDGGASSVGASIDTPTAPSFSFSTTPHQSSVKDAVTVRSGNVVSLRRLQWIALLNDSPRREWRWLGISAEPHSWTEQCRLVEASEKAELTAVEQHNATDLGDRCLHGQCETATASWRALRRWGWLDELMTTYSGQDGRAGLAEECGRGRLEDEELGRTAAAAETAAHDGLSPSACLGASQIITHFVRIACNTFQTLSATGATHARHSPAPAAADTTRTPVTSQTYAAPFETWEEALRTLASYCELLATNAEEVKEHDSARAVHHKKLLCAASAFIECSIAFWRALHAPLFTSADVNDAADVSSVLCAQYKTILDLHSAVALAQQKLALHHPGEEEREAAASALPSLPAELHADVFRLLTHARVPRWRQCEALLLLADDVATLSSAGAKTAGGGTPMTAARATPTWQGSFEIPLFVYAEVLTAYAAHQQPVPQQLRERCMRRLRGAL